MKKIIVVSFAVLGIGMAGCSNEEEWGVAQKGIDEINASMGTEGSRTAMNGNSVVWSEKDAVSVFTQSGSDIYNNKYDLKDGAGSGNATFSGKMEGENPVKVVALYPYAADATYGNGKVTLTMKSSYEYAENSNNSAPMACLIKPESSSTLAFKNAGALMSVTVNNIPAGYNKATLTSKAATNNDASSTVPALTGKAEITFDTGGYPTLGMTNDGGNGNVITITFTATTTGPTNKTFYFPIPVAEYPALEMAISNGSDEKVLKTKGLKAERSQRYTSTITLDEVSGSVPAEVSSVSDVAKALSSNNSVSVADVPSTESSPAITLPDKAADNMSISFDKISTTSAIKVAGTSSATNVAKEVLISVPQSASSEQSPKFEIELPKSTVTLAANGEAATYEEVTATTAQNTLIVGKGVTVKKLIVKGGNVRVNKGATVSAIERATDNGATVTIYKEEGATLPNLSGNNAFEVLDAALADLQNIAKEGGTYTLTKDLEGDFTISATADVTINLNGHKITNKSGDTFTVNKGSKLTISGSGTVDNVTHAKACIYNNGTVALNGGTYTRSKEASSSPSSSGGNSYYNILNHGEMTIQPGVIISSSGAFSSLIDNGYYNYTDKNERVGYVESKGQPNPSLTINGGTFSGGINTIKNDDGATLTIVNGTFTNMTQATVQNNNVAEIRGGEFNPTGSASHAVETKHNTTDYNKGETKISGGTFNGLMYVSGDSPSLTVTGGTFSDPSALTYLGNNADVKVVMNKDYTMAKALNIAEDANVTVDLNSKILEITDATIESRIKGTAYFKNGTINTANTFYAQSNGNLTFDNVKVIETRHTAIQAQGPNVKLTVKNNSVITGRYFGISTNASNSGAGQSPTYGQNATIVLENSRFDSEETGFMNNVPAKVTITGCEFSGNHQGVLLRGGDYTIKNSTFTLNASLDEASYAEDSWTAQSGKWADGNRCAFAGITMGNKESNSYQYYTKVAMENVTVKVEGTYASQYPAVYVAANKATDLGVTWTFDTSCVFGIGQTSIEYGSSNNITVNGSAIQPSDK